jgi:hypothetical protein
MTRDQYRAELTALRESVAGCAFEDAPEAFKDIEALKLRALGEFGELPRTHHPHIPPGPLA